MLMEHSLVGRLTQNNYKQIISCCKSSGRKKLDTMKEDMIEKGQNLI